MNSHQAKKIPLQVVLEHLGYEPVERKKGGRELWYISPFRKETDASFNILVDKNVWYDFGEAEGGNTLDFIVKLNSCDVKEALQFLSRFDNSIASTKNTPQVFQNENLFNQENKPQFTIYKTKKIIAHSLVSYLNERKISLPLAQQYLEEVHYRNKEGKAFFGLGMRNDMDGMEIRNKVFKTCIGKKSITYIRDGGDRTKISVFEGFFDFLSCLQEKKINRLRGDVVILHSLSLTKRVAKLVIENNYETLFDFLDNDDAGDKQREVIDSWNIKRKDMRYLFDGFKDYNEKLTGIER